MPGKQLGRSVPYASSFWVDIIRGQHRTRLPASGGAKYKGEGGGGGGYIGVIKGRNREDRAAYRGYIRDTLE